MRDETRGIRPGSTRDDADGFPAELPEPEPAPEVTELGWNLAVRRSIEVDVLAHAQFGQVEREAAASKAKITERLKARLPDLLEPNRGSTRTFVAQGHVVSLYPQRRTSFNHEKFLAGLKDMPQTLSRMRLLELFNDCLGISEYSTLKITAPKA